MVTSVMLLSRRRRLFCPTNRYLEKLASLTAIGCLFVVGEITTPQVCLKWQVLKAMYVTILLNLPAKMGGYSVEL